MGCSPRELLPTVLPSPVTLQLRCSIRLDTRDDALLLADVGGPPCVSLELPSPPSPADCSSHTAWAEQQAAIWAAGLLFASAPFRRRSGAMLVELRRFPLAASSGALAVCSALERLHICVQPGISHPDSLRGSALVCGPALRSLNVVLPSSATVLGHLEWPAGLEQCTVETEAAQGGISCCYHRLTLSPCSCPVSAARTGFWATLRSLTLRNTGGPLQLDVLACQATLKSCTELHLTSGGTPWDMRAASEEAPADILRRWLASLAPLFQDRPLRALQLQAAAASLQRSGLVDAGQLMLRAGGGGAAWPSAELHAAALPAGYCERVEDGVRGLTAELQRLPSSADSLGGWPSFMLRISRSGV